jgi:predicted DNA-binding protein
VTKTERLNIRISPELKEQLQRLAEAEGRTVSNYIETLIREKLARL